MEKDFRHYAHVDETDQPDQSVDIVSEIISPSESAPLAETPKNNSLKKNLIACVALALANLLFILCHKKCPFEDPTTCARTFIFPNLPRWALQISVSSIIFIAVIYQAAYGKISRFFIAVTVIDIIYLGFYYHPILNARDYGQMFGYFLILCIVMMTIFLIIGLSIRKCIRKSPLLTIIGIPLFLFTLSILFYFGKVRNSCDNWATGIGNEVIDNKGQTCKVNTPPVCAFEITSGWLDLSRFAGSCSNFKVKESIMEKYYPDAPVIGFPRTERFTQQQRLPIQKSILESTVPLASVNDPAAENLEIFLDKTTPNPSFQINLKKNQTLINERSKIKHEGLAKNVLVIYIDALSRANSIRKLPKTMSWFDSFMNKKDSKAEAFQFFKYHSIAPFTYPNLYEALYGHHPNDPGLSKSKPLDSFIKQYQDNGYITGHATDYCQTSPLDIYLGEPIKDTPYDHEALSIACDPHYHDPESPYRVLEGPYSSLRRCLYGKDVFEHVYEYGNQFWRTYKDEKKILYLDFLVAHEGTGEVIKYMDDALYNFLNNLQQENLLEDTAVVLYADHGLHMQGLFHLMDITQVFTEIALPALYTVLPKKVAEKYGNNIKANEQTLVSAHELYNFFFSLTEGEKSEKIEDSLLGPLSPATTCNDIGIVDGGKCACNF